MQFPQRFNAFETLSHISTLLPFTMSSFRVASRLSRTIRVQPALRQLRHESTQSSSSSSGGSFSPSLIGGLAGGGLVFLGGYGWYHFSGNYSIDVSIGYPTTQTPKANSNHQAQRHWSKQPTKPRQPSIATANNSNPPPQTSNPTKQSNGSAQPQNPTPPSSLVQAATSIAPSMISMLFATSTVKRLTE